MPNDTTPEWVTIGLETIAEVGSRDPDTWAKYLSEAYAPEAARVAKLEQAVTFALETAEFISGDGECGDSLNICEPAVDRLVEALGGVDSKGRTLSTSGTDWAGRIERLERVVAAARELNSVQDKCYAAYDQMGQCDPDSKSIKDIADRMMQTELAASAAWADLVSALAALDHVADAWKKVADDD